MSRLALADGETVAEVMPGGSALHTRVQAAAAYLRELLLRPFEAIVDNVDRIPIRADTNAITIEAGPGFSGLADPVYQPVAELFVVDMLLARLLAAGDTATLGYPVGFRYAQPPPEFRRVVRRWADT